MLGRPRSHRSDRMSIGSISSFWQQDQYFWQHGKAQRQATSANNALINLMGQVEVNQSRGMASIANRTALNRVNNQITALVQNVLQPNSGGSTSSSGAGGSSSSSSGAANSASSSSPLPATGTGTAPLTTTTALSTLGILPGGTITVTAGANMTTYTSTGSDTVSDLVNALNVDLPTNAQVTASLDGKGRLVITSRNTKDTIIVGGSGTDAAAIGFGLNNEIFAPTAPKSAAPAAAGAGSSSGATSSSSNAASSSAASTRQSSSPKTSVASQNAGAAVSILSADGVSGSLVNMLA